MLAGIRTCVQRSASMYNNVPGRVLLTSLFCAKKVRSR